MSFLSGIMSFGKSAVKYLSGNSIGGMLARTAIIGYAINRLSKNANKDSGSNIPPNIDQGVRLQYPASADAKIPVLYGSAFFGGNLTDAAMTNSNKTMWYCLTLAEKTGNLYSTSTATAYTLTNVYWNDQRIVFKTDGITVDYTVDRAGTIDRNLSGLVQVYFYAGGRTLGQKPTGYAGAVPNAETLFPNWTAGTHAMSNLLFALIKVDYNREKNSVGLGDVKFNIGSTLFTPGDVLYDYLTNTTYGAGIDAGNILTTDITALNTHSLASVAYADQGTGAATLADRYQINGLIDTKQPVLQNAEKILSAAASWLSYDTHEGKWGIVINKADTSVASFSDANIIGNISLTGTGLQDLANSVKVEFPHRELRDSADFYNIAVPTSSIPADWTPFSRNTNEEDKVLELSYDIINEPIQAQLLGLIELKQSRIDKMIQFKTDFSFYNVKAGDIIDVTNTRFGFSAKTFRVISITEIQDNDGALQMEISALEYDVNVYSIADLYRFTRSDANGIQPLGAIGTPGTPVASKIEQDARPRVEISSTAPTGLVEGMEFWLTTDVALAEENRSYNLISTKKPVGGGVYTSGTAVVLDYDSLGTTDFFVKTRGFNTNTVGPFSAVSGLVEFQPTQVTDAIDANTQAFDSTGGLLGALALVELLGKLSDLFGAGDSGKSLFDRIFETFEDVTGIDLVGDAAGGSLVVTSNLSVKADSVSLGATTASIDFVGPIEASGSSDITVKLKDGTANKDILAWNASTGKWETISGCIACDFPPPVVPPTPAVPCSLVVSSTLPPNNFTLGATCPAESVVPFTGSMFITWTINPGSALGGAANPAIPITAPLVKGTGNFKLYTTNGDLIQTLPVADTIVHNNVLELPFRSRSPGTDYYVIWDEGVLTSCACENALVNNATTWTFTTSRTPQSPYARPATLTFATGATGDDTSPIRPRVGFTQTPAASVCSTSTPLILTFAQKVKKGSGSISIKDIETGSTVASFAVSAATLSASAPWTVNFGNITGLTQGKSYEASAPNGLLLTDTPATSTTVCDTTTNTPALPDRQSEAKTWGLNVQAPLAITNFATCTLANGKTAQTTNFVITFNKNIAVKATGPAYVYIKQSGIIDTTHQRIDLRGTYAANKYGAIYSVSGNTLTLNPTEALKGDTTYYINIDAGTILDAECDLAFPAVTSTTQLSCVTDGAKATPPQGLTYGSVLLDFEYDRPVKPGPGKLNIVTPGGVLLTQISATDIAVKFRDNQPF